MDEKLAMIPAGGPIIEVQQLPIITERLRTVKDAVEKATQEAAGLVCTGETVQAVKNTRAELRKQFDELETQRKAVKAAVMGPYEAFLKVYDECISMPFRIADNKLKEQIDGFEADLKKGCEERLRLYHEEMIRVHGVDFLTFDKAMALGRLKISMADANAKTPKKLMDGIAAVTASVADDVSRITDMEDSAEIMAEYKKCFDVGLAVSEVQRRKRAVEAEKEAAEQRKIEEARKAEVVAKVDAVAPPVAAPAEPEKIFTIKFTVKCTREQGRKLKQFLITEGIQYE